MKESVCFSFIMPAYKTLYLSKAIESILNQTYTSFELVIINDASPENLKAIVQRYNDARIIYLENEQNIGGKDLVSNWNHCIKYAKYNHIILATDDDEFCTQFLSESVKLIEKYPNVNIIRSGVEKINEEGKTLDLEFPLKEYMTSKEFTLYYAKGGLISCISNYIFKKDALENNGGFISLPKAHFSDDATVIALSANGIACIPLNQMKFRVSTINLSNSSDLKTIKDQIKATELFMIMFLEHIKALDTIPDDFFERACYGGFKAKYITMIEKLTDKIGIRHSLYAISTIIHDINLFKREKLKLIANYFINKL